MKSRDLLPAGMILEVKPQTELGYVWAINVPCYSHHWAFHRKKLVSVILGLEETDFVTVSFSSEQRGKNQYWGSIMPNKKIKFLGALSFNFRTTKFYWNKICQFLLTVGVFIWQRHGRAANLLWGLGQDTFLNPYCMPSLWTWEGCLDDPNLFLLWYKHILEQSNRDSGLLEFRLCS